LETVVSLQIGEKLQPGIFQKHVDASSIKMGIDISTVLQDDVTGRKKERK